MDSSQTIQPSYQSFCRLIQNDDSSNFSFFINFNRDQTEIKTTLNKARIISKKVNTYYQADPTIQKIEIKIPPHINLKEEQTNIKDKIEKIFQTIINSTDNPQLVSKKDQFLNILLMRLIEYENVDDKQNKTEIIKFISTINETVSLLTTDAVHYLSMNFVEFLKSDMFDKIEEEIILDIIDVYTDEKKMKEINQSS